jgi:hypothetical protein
VLRHANFRDQIMNPRRWPLRAKAVSATTLAAVSLAVATACSTQTAHLTPVIQSTPSATHAAVALTASQFATRMGVKDFTAYNATTDPNKLLGRQGEYISKINWSDAGDPGQLSNSIEVFSNTGDMNARLDYLKAFKPPFGDGYDYTAGTAILRLSSDWTPAQAKQLQVKFNAAQGSAS